MSVIEDGEAHALIVTLTNPPLMLIFYELFKVVNLKLALLAAFFGLVATGIEGASLFVRVEHPIVAAYGVYAAFFGVELMTTGYLTYKWSFLPRAIDVLLVIDGDSYLAYSFIDILAPASQAISSPGFSCQFWLVRGRSRSGCSSWASMLDAGANETAPSFCVPARGASPGWSPVEPTRPAPTVVRSDGRRQ